MRYYTTTQLVLTIWIVSKVPPRSCTLNRIPNIYLPLRFAHPSGSGILMISTGDALLFKEFLPKTTKRRTNPYYSQFGSACHVTCTHYPRTLLTVAKMTQCHEMVVFCQFINHYKNHFLSIGFRQPGNNVHRDIGEGSAVYRQWLKQTW